MTKVEKL